MAENFEKEGEFLAIFQGEEEKQKAKLKRIFLRAYKKGRGMMVMNLYQVPIEQIELCFASVMAGPKVGSYPSFVDLPKLSLEESKMAEGFTMGYFLNIVETNFIKNKDKWEDPKKYDLVWDKLLDKARAIRNILNQAKLKVDKNFVEKRIRRIAQNYAGKLTKKEKENFVSLATIFS